MFLQLFILTFLFPNLIFSIFFNQPLNVTRFDVSKLTKYVTYSKNERIVVLQKFGNDYVLLGARNRAYNISLLTMREVDRFEWPTSNGARENCGAISQSPSTCDNYIRTFFELPKSSSFILCGTHGLQPTCAEFRKGNNAPFRTFPGTGMSPVDAESSSLFIRSLDNIITLNVAELSSSEPLLIRRNVLKMWKGIENDVILRTPRGLSSFEQATFLSMFHDSPSEILFFFSESPMDFEGCGLHKVPRVGRICADDQGGKLAYAKEWSSYAKSRIECRIEENDADTFYFNQFTSISQSPTSYYGAFRSQLAGIGASSICKFDRKTITATISNSYKSANRSEKCVKPRDVDEMSRMRIKPLIKQKISAHPIFVFHGKDKFVNVVAQEGVSDIRNNLFDILYIATNLGNILKVVTLKNNGTARHSSTMRIGDLPGKIVDMWILEQPIPNQIIIEWLVLVTENSVQDYWEHLFLTTCSMASTCAECLSLGDPHCAWADAGECIDVRMAKLSRKYSSQDSGTCDVSIGNNLPLPIPPLVSKNKPVCLCETTSTTPCTTEVIQRDIVRHASSGIWSHLSAFAFGLFVAAILNIILTCRKSSDKSISSRSSSSTNRPIATIVHQQHPIDAFTNSSNGGDVFGSNNRFNTISMHSSIRTYC